MEKLKSLGAVLDFAIAREHEAVAFYEALADSVPDGKHRDVFLGFAAEELGHKRKLESVKLKSDKSTLLATTPALDIDYRRTTPPMTPTMSFKEILGVATQWEKEAVDLYSGMAESTMFAPLKAICIALAKEEEKHRHRLETLYNETA